MMINLSAVATTQAAMAMTTEERFWITAQLFAAAFGAMGLIGLCVWFGLTIFSGEYNPRPWKNWNTKDDIPPGQ